MFSLHYQLTRVFPLRVNAVDQVFDLWIHWKVGDNTSADGCVLLRIDEIPDSIDPILVIIWRERYFLNEIFKTRMIANNLKFRIKSNGLYRKFFFRKG